MAHAPGLARTRSAVPAVPDSLGVVLVVALAAWTALVAGGGAGRPGPVVLLLVGLVASVALGRILGERSPAAVAIATAGAVFLTWPGALSAAGPPTGYANTNATLAGIGLLSAVGAAIAARGATTRRAWWALGVVLGVVVLATGSVAGLASLAVALGLTVTATLVRRPAVVVVGGLIAISAVLGVTGAIASGADVFGLEDRAGVRADLWSGAVDLAADHPWFGVGPGEFATSDDVTADADLRWAHSGYLQILAELGATGFGLVVGIAGWIWARLWHVSSRSPRRAGIGAAVVTMVGLHATVDYVFHVPAALLAAAVLVSWATALPRERPA